MTQQSGLWTTSGTPSGHQVASYTQALASVMLEVITACLGKEGVAPGYLNLLAGTVTGANTVQIDTGGALVDGKYYKNDAAVSVNIPSAVGGGNTRIDRIVLRASWASFQITIVRIAGTDAASPTAPAITQTPGTTYDITLYKALVNTSGTVTLTDERTFASQAILARQGGSSSIWSTAGTISYFPGKTSIQTGMVNWTGASAASGTFTINVPIPFTNNGIIVVMCTTTGVTCYGVSVGLGSFACGWSAGSNKTSLDFNWIAIGPA